MKLKKQWYKSPDILFVSLTGLLAVIVSFFPGFEIIRWLAGFFFVFFGSGYAVTRFLPKKSNAAEKVISAAGISLLLTYPVSVLTVIWEGQTAQAIFGPHLTRSLIVLFLVSLLFTFWVVATKKNENKFGNFPLLLTVPLTLYLFLTLTVLNRADVYGDEYDLGYQAYNLVDGIKAGRKAFTVSFSGHPPLSMNIKHFSMNLLESGGLDELADWQFRVSEAIVGSLVLITVYLIVSELMSDRAALISTLLLSVNNYMVWLGRIFHREMYLTFFLVLSLYFFIRFLHTHNSAYLKLSGIALGASLLVKETAFILLLTYAIFAFIKRNYAGKIKKIILLALLIFSPVVLYNLLAFITTGYADVFFSNLFGIQRPGATPVAPMPLINLLSILTLLYDIYSPLVSVVFLAALALLLIRKKNEVDHLLLIFCAITLIFFAFTAVRSYYFLFLTVPLVIFTVKAISGFSKAPLAGLMFIVLGYSYFYSWKTNLDRSYFVNEIGKIDGAVILKHPLTMHYSLAVRSWVEETGYKNLQKSLDSIIQNNDCLIVDNSLNELAVRRYLGQKDAVKEHYLGTNYASRYQRCPRNSQAVTGTIYLISSQPQVSGKLETVITAHLGNLRFYLYRLAKGTYS